MPPPTGLGMYGLAGPGEPGWGDQAGLYPGLYPLSLAADGEKPAAPGVIPLPTPGDQALAYAGVAPCCHGVI